MKPRTVDPTAEQQRFHDWLRAKGHCQVCSTSLNLVIHHLLASVPGKQGRRDHWFVVLICAGHHNMGIISVHGCGSEAKFRLKTGVDLVAAAVRNLEDYRNDVAR